MQTSRRSTGRLQRLLGLALLLLTACNQPDPGLSESDALHPPGKIENVPWSDRAPTASVPANPYADGRAFPWKGVSVGGAGLSSQALGSGVNYLSDLSYTTASSGYGPIELDRSNGQASFGDGTVLTLQGVTFPKGLGVHSNSALIYNLSSACTSFDATVGVDDEVGNNGSVIFQVYADGTKLYDSGLMTGASASKVVSVPLTGKSELKLVVDGNGNIDYDHADWADAKVTCSAPTPVNNPFLSELSPSAASNGWGPIEKDRSNGENQAGDGQPLSIRGTSYGKGLGMHANASTTYPLNANCTKFTALVGIDDEVKGLGSVIFQVFTDGVKVYDSGAVGGADPVKPVNIDVTGKANLQLVVDGNGSIDYDHADWADAKLVCAPATSGPEITSVDDLTIDPTFLRPAVFLGGEAYFASTDLESPDLTYAWDFGDGTSATGSVAAHQYAQPGYYTAKMTVTNGARQTKTSTAQIAVMPDIHDMPSARAVVLGMPVTFDVRYPVAGLTYAWDFGDGQGGTGAQVQHLYTKRSFQDVTLTIYDDRAALPASGTVGPSPAVTDPAGRPVLDERETRVNNIVPLPTAVIDAAATGPLNISLSAVNSAGATALTYSWDFGDGTVLTGPNVSRTYTQDGRYPITLTVADQYGQTDSAHQVVVLGTRADDAQIYSMNVNLGTGGQASLSAQSLISRPADAQVQKALSDAQRRASKAVIYLKGTQPGDTGGPRIPADTSTQSIKAQATSDIDHLLFPYPFVIPSNPAAITGMFNSQGYLGTGQFDRASASMSLNGVGVPLGQGWTTNCAGADCSSATLDRSFFPAAPMGLRTGINTQTFNFQTVEATGTVNPPAPRTLSALRSFSTDLPVFSGLRVPRVALNIVPDTQLTDVTVKRYAYDNAGRREFFAQVNVPESAITSGGYAPFVIPMYAVDQNGQLMTNLNGAFDAKFSDPRLYSGTREGTMIGGVTEMVVYVPVSTFTDGVTKFDLNSVLVGPAGCGQDNNFAFGGFSESGCQTITATSDVPMFPGASMASPSGLKALSTNGIPSQYEIQNYPYLVLQEVSNNFNRFLFGTVGQRKYIDALKAYDGSNAALLVGLLPFVGDSADLLTQAYFSKFDNGGDPIVVTLAAIGLSVDALTGVGGEPVTAVKSAYKISKTASGFLADDIRTTVKEIIDGKLKPTVAIKLVLDKYGTFAKIFLKDGKPGVILADRLANGLTSLPTCPVIGTLSLTAQSCSKLNVLQTVVRLSEKLFALNSPRIEVFRSFINVCCSKALGGGGYIRGAEKLLAKASLAKIPSDITGILSEARAGTLFRDAGKAVEFPGENTFKLLNGGTSAPDLVLRDAAGNITHLIEVKTGSTLTPEKEAILKDMIQVLNSQNPATEIRPGFIALVKELSKTQLDRYRRIGVDVFDKSGRIIN